MNTLVYHLVWISLLIILVAPFVAATALRILLRKNGFRASVGGPKTFTRICFKYQIKMNLQVLVNIDSVSLKFRIPNSCSELTEFFNT
jgi:hypothetical protein